MRFGGGLLITVTNREGRGRRGDFIVGGEAEDGNFPKKANCELIGKEILDREMMVQSGGSDRGEDGKIDGSCTSGNGKNAGLGYLAKMEQLPFWKPIRQ